MYGSLLEAFVYLVRRICFVTHDKLITEYANTRIHKYGKKMRDLRKLGEKKLKIVLDM